MWHLVRTYGVIINSNHDVICCMHCFHGLSRVGASACPNLHMRTSRFEDIR